MVNPGSARTLFQVILRQPNHGSQSVYYYHYRPVLLNLIHQTTHTAPEMAPIIVPKEISDNQVICPGIYNQENNSFPASTQSGITRNWDI